MTAPGAAKQTVASQQNYVRIANLFLAFVKQVSPELSAKWGESCDAVPEKHAAGTDGSTYTTRPRI